MSKDIDVETLECFLGGKHIGRFERRYLTTIEFVYDTHSDTSDEAQLLSLSLPRDRPHSINAAQNFLSNLLPETDAA